jgi:hypothetical protein
MGTNEPTILRLNRHCLQCRSIAHNVRVLGEEAVSKTIFPTSAKWYTKKKQTLN